MASSKILIVENVTKKFGGLVALDKVSLHVNDSEILGLIGPNGAGKTTLFNCITGVYKPEEGRIIFRGQDITGWPPHRIARLGIARTFQIVKPFNELTVKQNVVIGSLFGKRHGEVDINEAEEKADEILEFIGLKDKAEQPAKNLNIHEKKMLEIARALASEPDLLLLDEALAGLTPREIDEMLKVISKIRDERRISIIMVEHVMHAVMNIADRLVVLNYGRKIAEGTPEEIANNPEVIKAYLGDAKLALQFVKRIKRG
ncbi:MAG: ABC transporter ATP-binding protein [Pyrodictiaceae archaeon]